MTKPIGNDTAQLQQEPRRLELPAENDPYRRLLWAVLIQAAEDAADSRNLELALSAREWLAEHGAEWLDALGSDMAGDLAIWIRRGCTGGHKARHIARLKSKQIQA